MKFNNYKTAPTYLHPIRLYEPQILPTSLQYKYYNTVTMDVHPLMLIEPNDLPASLREKFRAGEMTEEFSGALHIWIEHYFGIKIQDNEAFKDAVIFFSEIWKHPEMIERVQNLLLAKHILEAETYQAAWKWTRAIDIHDLLSPLIDIEALKIVMDASEVVQRANEDFFSKNILSFLSLNPSPKDLLSRMEAFAKENNVVYEPLPETGFEKKSE